MDKTQEVNPSPENLQIPDNWNFGERNEGNTLKAIRIDKDEGYLAFSIPKQGWRIEYFFSRNGLPMLSRSYLNSGSSVTIHKWDETQAQFAFGYEPKLHLNVGFSIMGDLDAQPKTAADLGVSSHAVYFTDKGSIDKLLLQIPKLEGRRQYIEFSGFDDREVRYRLLKPVELHGLKILDQEQPNQLILGNNQGKGEHVMVWETIIGEDREGKKVPFFVVTQSHFDADNQETRIILKSPTQIDMEKVKESLLSVPPYPKDDKGKIVVPWRNIDQIVGASISYSSPPPKQS